MNPKKVYDMLGYGAILKKKKKCSFSAKLSILVSVRISPFSEVAFIVLFNSNLC